MGGDWGRGRIAFLFFLFVSAFLLVIVRLAYLQLYRNDFFAARAKEQYESRVEVLPERGVIHDRNGEPLAMNILKPSAFVVPNILDPDGRTFEFLEEKYPEVFSRLEKNPKSKFTWLERKISAEKKAELSAMKLPGLYFVDETSRLYPFSGSSFAMGFSGVDNNGLSGVELACESLLQGVPSVFVIDRDARSNGLYFSSNIEKRGCPGTSVTLTLDKGLSCVVADELEKTVKNLGAESGSTLILEPNSGDVLAMVTCPEFDPNRMREKPPKSTKSQVVHDSFEFGSVIKMFTALAALEEGVVDPETVIDCGGASAVVNKTRIENWRPLGVLPFRDVIRRSSNVGVAKTALKLGNKLYDHFDKLGFGKKTGLNFPGERTGFLNASKKWSRSSPLVMSYGYELSSTLLQLGKATCIIANGGHSVEPRLMLDDWVYENRGERLYSEKAVAQTKEILEGIGKRYPIDGFKVFGKTGTARCLRNKRYSKNDHVFSFSGAIEQGEYSRVVVTFIKEAKKVEHWMTAAQIAGPLFQRIAQRMVLLDKMRGVI